MPAPFFLSTTPRAVDPLHPDPYLDEVEIGDDHVLVHERRFELPLGLPKHT